MSSNVVELAFGTDRARTRRSDLSASHEAGDVSAEQREIIKAIVRQLLIDAGTKGLTDRELTRAYFADESNPGCMLDTPRKRRSDLTTIDREVIVTNERRKRPNEKVATHVWIHRTFLEKRTA